MIREIWRVEQLVKQISALIEYPATDLSVTIRKNVERAECEACSGAARYAVRAAGIKITGLIR